MIGAFAAPTRSNRGEGAPVWWETAVVYQMYVRSFADSNGDGVGDLAGIRSRLPYLAALGVDAIWLTPCYPSPQHDHGYDVADYFDIEPDYGDLDEFDALVAGGPSDRPPGPDGRGPEPLQLGPPVVPRGAGAPPGSRRHASGSTSATAEAPHGDEPPNNWPAIFGGSAWTRVDEPDGSPGQWYLALFTPAQPDFDWNHPDVVDHFDRVLRFWFDRGVDGFRVDSVTVVGKAPGLPDPRRTRCPPVGAGSVDITVRLPARRPRGVAPLAPRGRRLRG